MGFFGDKIDDILFPKQNKRFTSDERKVLEKFGHLLIKHFNQVELKYRNERQWYDRKDRMTESLDYTYEIDGLNFKFTFMKFYSEKENHYAPRFYADEDIYEDNIRKVGNRILDADTGIEMLCTVIDSQNRGYWLDLFKRPYDERIPVRYIGTGINQETTERFNARYKEAIITLKEYLESKIEISST